MGPGAEFVEVPSLGVRIAMVVSGLCVASPRRPAGSGTSALSLRLFLCVFPDLNHTIVMAVHTIYALFGLCKDEIIDPVLADLAFEAVGVVRIVASHDSLVQDGLSAYVAAV